MSATIRRIQDLHVPIVVVGPDGLIGYANPAAHRMFAYAPGTLLGKPFAQLTTEASWQELSREPVLHGNARVGRVQGQAVRSDGSVVDVNMTIEPALRDSTNPDGQAFVFSYEPLPPWKVRKAV